MSQKFKDFLHNKGIATSRTTSYNPAGNGQAETLNGIIWQAIILALKTHKLLIICWQDGLPDALHSIRTCSALQRMRLHINVCLIFNAGQPLDHQ